MLPIFGVFLNAGCPWLPVRPAGGETGLENGDGQYESPEAPPVESDEEITLIADGRVIVLGEAGVWSVSTVDAADAGLAESWRVGDRVRLRVLGLLSVWDQIHGVVSGEVVHSSGEASVDVIRIGFAEEVTVTELTDGGPTFFSNGFTSDLVWGHATGWEVGDRVLLISEGLRGEWYIHVETADFIGFSLVY